MCTLCNSYEKLWQELLANNEIKSFNQLCHLAKVCPEDMEFILEKELGFTGEELIEGLK